MKPPTAQVTLTADLVVMRPVDQILLIRRLKSPYQGYWALPGGKMNEGETIEDCAVRELYEETGLQGDFPSLIGVWSTPGRDPRGCYVSIAFALDGVSDQTALAGDDAAEARWFPLKALPPLAFDHEEIIAKALQLRGHEGYEDILMNAHFSVCDGSCERRWYCPQHNPDGPYPPIEERTERKDAEEEDASPVRQHKASSL